MTGHAEQSLVPTDLVIGLVALVLITLPIGGLSWIAQADWLCILLFTDADLPTRRGALAHYC
jgi:hypothetical protein